MIVAKQTNKQQQQLKILFVLNNVMWNIPMFNSNNGMFYKTLSVPEYIVMDMNMFWTLFGIVQF